MSIPGHGLGMAVEYATLGGGCFWCVEAAYRELQGVKSAVSGYMGGQARNPTYEDVCGGDTGHAEVVQIQFDPAVLSYREVLEVFFTIHDPTTLNRQGADTGTQYRSVVFTHSPVQAEATKALMKELEAEGAWEGIVTEVAPATVFYPAEDYHQDYFKRNPTQGYCAAVIRPKMEKFRKSWKGKLKG